MSIWKEAADIQTADMLNLPVPEAEYITVTTEPSAFQQEMVVELVKLLRSISNNVHQIARRCNETRNLYAQDVEDLRRGYAQVWEGINGLLKKFETL